MKLSLKWPCANCPFRTDYKFYLSVSRVREILHGLIKQDQSFACHKTTTGEYDEDGQYVYTHREQHCAGAMIMLQHMKMPNQWMRIMARVGLFDPNKLKMDAPVFHTPAEMIKEYTRRNRRFTRK